MRSNSNADAPRQGERPRFCCHQRHDTTAQLEGPTLAEKIQIEKLKRHLYMLYLTVSARCHFSVGISDELCKTRFPSNGARPSRQSTTAWIVCSVAFPFTSTQERSSGKQVFFHDKTITEQHDFTRVKAERICEKSATK